jgi:hypothetical protein
MYDFELRQYENLWAFDLDGVLAPDLNLDKPIISYPKLEQEQVVSELVQFLCNNYFPFFEPPMPYVIITGRPVCDKKYTEEWIENKFHNKPLELFHDATTQPDGLGYKVEILNNFYNISYYVESDIKQVEYIRKNVERDDLTVIHFKDFIKSAFNLLDI